MWIVIVIDYREKNSVISCRKEEQSENQRKILKKDKSDCMRHQRTINDCCIDCSTRDISIERKSGFLNRLKKHSWEEIKSAWVEWVNGVKGLMSVILLCESAHMFFLWTTLYY